MVIGAITPTGRRCTQVHAEAFRGPVIAAFLRQLLRQGRGMLLVVWDGALIHRSRRVKDVLAAGAAARLHLVQRPGYAPGLNPDEGGWNHLKRVELMNRCCHHLEALRWERPFAIRSQRTSTLN